MTSLNPEIKQEAPAPEPTPSQENHVTQQKLETPESKEESVSEDPNWRAFREARKKDRQEREAAEKKAQEKEAEVAALKAAMEAAFSKSAPTPQAYQQYYGMEQSEESEDDRIEKKVNALLEVREKKRQQEQMAIEQREYPTKLARDFSDFGQVCSQENLDYLDYHFPELSRPLQRLPDGYDKWADIYRAVKKFIPNHSTVRQEVARADMNSNKPRSMSVSAPSPTGQKAPETWQDTERRRAENWARMQRVAKGLQ